MTHKFGLNLIALALMLGYGALQSAGAEQTYQVPVFILGGSALQVAEADASQMYGIRPAKDAPSPISSDSGSPMSPPADDVLGGANSPQSMERSSEIQNDSGIRYVSGGIGESERTELAAISNQFNLYLMFAQQGSGEYLSAVSVNISDARSQSILTAESKGPLFLVKLAPGDYNVEVTPTGEVGHGQAQRKTAHVGESGQSRLDFYWR